MTNRDAIKAILKPRTNQIRIYGNWVEIEIQHLAISFSCGLEWWNTKYKENDLGVEKIIDELEKEFEKVNIPIMYKLTLFAKTQNALYRCAELNNLEYLNNSVTPQEPRKGHWVLRNSFLVPYECSECNYESERYDNYCPNCGCRMVEPQESGG